MRAAPGDPVLAALAVLAVLAVPLWALPADQRGPLQGSANTPDKPSQCAMGQLGPVRLHRRNRGIFILQSS